MKNCTSIDELREGMILVSPVVNKYGYTLITSGTRLAFRHISLLKSWGITSVEVNNTNSNNVDDSEFRQMAIEQIQKRLFWEPKHPVEIDMYNLAVNKLTFDLMHKKNTQK